MGALSPPGLLRPGPLRRSEPRRSAELRTCVADRQHFPDVPVAVGPVKIAPAQPCVELPVLGAHRGAAIGDAGGTYTCENAVELHIADMEALVVAVELLTLGKIQGQGLTDIHWRKVTAFRFPRRAEDIGQLLCRGNGIVRWNDQMVE